jgi:hypothetical protein
MLEEVAKKERKKEQQKKSKQICKNWIVICKQTADIGC